VRVDLEDPLSLIVAGIAKREQAQVLIQLGPRKSMEGLIQRLSWLTFTARKRMKNFTWTM